MKRLAKSLVLCDFEVDPLSLVLAFQLFPSVIKSCSAAAASSPPSLLMAGNRNPTGETQLDASNVQESDHPLSQTLPALLLV